MTAGGSSGRAPLLAAIGAVAAAAGFLLLGPSGGPGPDRLAEDGASALRTSAAPSGAEHVASGIEHHPPSSAAPKDVDAPSVGESGQATADEPQGSPAVVAPVRSPERGDALREQARKDLASGRPAEALAALEAAVEADPSAVNHGELGDLLLKLTAIDRAIYHLEQSAELDPASADRWIALANAWYRKPDPGAAWKAERRAREAEPGLVLGYGPNGLRVRIGGREPDAR